jgi:hypothetical protein
MAIAKGRLGCILEKTKGTRIQENSKKTKPAAAGG